MEVFEEIGHIIAKNKKTVVLLSDEPVCRIAFCPKEQNLMHWLGTHIEIAGVDEYSKLLHSADGFNNSKKPLYRIEDENNELHLNQAAYDLLAHHYDYDLPGKQIAEKRDIIDSDYLTETLRWNAERGKIILANKEEKIFKHQMNDRVFSITSNADNLNLFDYLVSAKLEDEKDYICVSREQNGNHTYFFKGRGIKKLIDNAFLDIEKLPEFENKFAMVRNLAKKSTAIADRNWVNDLERSLLSGNNRPTLNDPESFRRKDDEEGHGQLR